MHNGMGLDLRDQGEEVKKTRGLIVNKSERREATEDNQEVVGPIMQEMRSAGGDGRNGGSRVKKATTNCPRLIHEAPWNRGQTHFNLVCIFTLRRWGRALVIVYFKYPFQTILRF